MNGFENVSGADNQQERLKVEINPWYISGFVDGEGSFHVAFARRPDLPKGWSIIPEFHISQDISRSNVLQEIKEYFTCGRIQENNSNSPDKTLVFIVRNRKDLINNILPFFEAYPLRSHKQKDFIIFQEIVRLMDLEKHLTNTGFNNIVKKAFQMNGNGKYRKFTMDDILLTESSETTC